MKKKFLILIVIFLAQCENYYTKNKLKEKTNSAFIYQIFNQPKPTTNSPPPLPQEDLGAKFGILGDSWTNFIQFSQTDLKLQLETRGFRILGNAIQGLTLNSALAQNLHRNTIDQAGKNIKYMIISLSGNDLLGNINAYIGVSPGGASLNTRIVTIQSNLQTMIFDGNNYKKTKYGGNNLIWILHGYDYINQTMPVCSIATPITQSMNNWGTVQGLSLADMNFLSLNGFNSLNTMMQNIASGSSGEVYYIDLRSTLGGPPNSSLANMIDCIHPNQTGFNLLGNKYANSIFQIVGQDR
jgi:hypothetical protein